MISKRPLRPKPDRRLGRRIPRGVKLDATLFYRDIGRYAEQVQRYFDVFGRENVHVIVYDDFQDDTASVYRETLRFLGVDQEFQPCFEVKIPTRWCGTTYCTVSCGVPSRLW